MRPDELTDSTLPQHAIVDSGIAALVLVVSSSRGLISRVSDYSGYPADARRWLHLWLTNRRQELEECGVMELNVGVSFLVLTARGGAPLDRYSLGEFTYGGYPAVPEEWPTVVMRQLLTHALESLT